MLAIAIPFVGDAAKAMFDALASAMEAAGTWGVNGMVHALTATTTPDLSAGWFSGPSSPYHTMRLVVLALGVPVILFGLCQSLLRSDVGEMARRGLLYPILAGAATVAVVAVTTLLVTASDQMSAVMLASTGHDFGKFAAEVFPVSVGTAVATADPAPAFVLIGLSVATLIAAFFIWVELVVRMAAIYLAVLFMPLALVALCWQAGAGAAKRLAEFLVAVIFSKFVIAGAIAVGAASLAAPVSGGPGTETAKMVGGMALLALAGFAPVALLRWIPLAESAVATHGLGRRPIQAARQADSDVGRARQLLATRSPGDSSGQAGADKTGGAAEKAGGPGGGAAAAAGPAGAAVVAAQAAAKVARQAGGVTDAAGGGNADKGANGPSQAGGQGPTMTGSQGAGSDKPLTGAGRG